MGAVTIAIRNCVCLHVLCPRIEKVGNRVGVLNAAAMMMMVIVTVVAAAAAAAAAAAEVVA